jgi:Kef-type K+ transport system membrane component KefB
MDSHQILILLSAVICSSYLFNLVSRRTGIPSVILLLGTGIAAQYLFRGVLPDASSLGGIVQFLGMLGLIMIVLEASLDLTVSRGALPVIRSSFLAAAAVLSLTSLAVALLIQQVLGTAFLPAWLYAIALSVISSAIAIPSAIVLTPEKREFITYESAFSDILGVMLFNFLAGTAVYTGMAFLSFGLSVLAMIVVSLAASMLLVYIAARMSSHPRFFLLLALVLLLYAVAKIMHFPALLLVIIFGVVLRNLPALTGNHAGRLISSEAHTALLDLFHALTAESSFLIRTFFFVIFGYTIDLSSLARWNVVGIGLAILAIIVVIRWAYFRLFIAERLFPEVLLMPRGLITVLLFYSIPASHALPQFESGILFFVVIGTSLLMSAGLIIFRRNHARTAVELVER